MKREYLFSLALLLIVVGCAGKTPPPMGAKEVRQKARPATAPAKTHPVAKPGSVEAMRREVAKASLRSAKLIAAVGRCLCRSQMREGINEPICESIMRPRPPRPEPKVVVSSKIPYNKEFLRELLDYYQGKEANLRRRLEGLRLVDPDCDMEVQP